MIDAFAQGADAYIAGAAEDANPYDLATQEALYLDWQDGWNNAADEADPDEAAE